MSGAPYLFYDHPTAKYDIGDKTLFCGRRADGVKLFLSLKKHGIDGMRKIANRALDNARYITEQINARPNFEMVHEPMSVNICFWYTPPYYMENPEEWNDEAKNLVHKYLYKAQQVHSPILIQYNPLPKNSSDELEKDLPNMFRLVIKSEQNNFDDMDFLLNTIEDLGKDITPELLATEEY